MFASKDLFLTPPSGGYTIARSVRMRSSASAYLNRTLTTPTNNKIWTYSFWIKRGKLGVTQRLFFATGTDNLFFSADDVLNFYIASAGSGEFHTTQVFRDPSAWYHIVIAVDTTQATSTNRVKIYVNGVQVTSFSGTTLYPTQNYNTYINSAVSHAISGYGVPVTQDWLDGYLTEINFVDGQQLTPSSFGETDSITGVWKPKAYSGTYGTNGFELNFSDNSASTATTIGKDYSGNGNNWTPNNISVTAGVTYDSMTDVPTLTSATAANYAVLNPLDKNTSSITISDGNLKYATSGTNFGVRGSISVSSGKWYWETTITAVGTGSLLLGIANATWDLTYVGSTSGSYGYFSANGNKGNNTSFSAYGATFTTNDVIGIALDMDAGTLTFYKNNTSQGTAFTGLSGSFFPAFSGQTSDSAAVNFGQRPFSYTPPTGFVSLNTYNLPASTITNGASYMYPVLRTGFGASGGSVTSLAFQPDLIWEKTRNLTGDHFLVDSVRTISKTLSANTTAAEATNATYFTSFNSNGYSLGSGDWSSSYTLVDWCWKAGTTSASNTNGSITSTVSAGATQGFSVVTYTGNGTGGATVGHGLGVAPNFILAKGRTNVDNWRAYHSSLGNTGALILNATNSFVTNSTFWNNTSPSSTVVTLGSDTSVNQSSNTFVLYCFSAVAGYSAFGSYTGNSSADGPFLYTGFRPRWVMLKVSAGQTGEWLILDTSRDTYNTASHLLYANSSAAEDYPGGYIVDILSNGFKLRNSSFGFNNTSGTYIWAAFAESPFKTSLAR
jgi:hypothetical protein